MSIAGTYEMVSSENYDQYLKAVGVGIIQRNLANTAKPILTWIDGGNGKWTQKTSTLVKSFEITFTLGEEFEEKTADDRVCKSVITLEGSKLIHKQQIGDLEAQTVREFNGNEMTTTFSSQGVTSVKKFKKTK